MKEFYSEMSRFVPQDARIMMCAFRGDPGADIPGKWRAKVLSDLNQIDEQSNLYLCISAMRRNERGEFRRRKENFAGGLLLMIDDLGTGLGAKQPLDTIEVLPPTAIVETSPDNFQAIYMYDRLEEDALKVDALIRAFVGTCLLSPTNSGMDGINRVFRPPSGVNAKPKYGGNFKVNLREWNPQARYSIDEIAKAYKLDLIKENRRARSDNWVANHKPDRLRLFLETRRTLAGAGMIKSEVNMSGWQDIRCPWVHTHSDGADNGASIKEPDEGNEFSGAFRCHHGHCTDKGWRELTDWLDEDAAEELNHRNITASERMNNG